MGLGDVFILIVIVGIAMLWWQQDAFRRRALALAKRACARAEVQFLDDSVGLRRVRLRRLDGHLTIERHFGFEFSPSGAARYDGVVIFHGNAVGSVDLDLAHSLPE